jgi:hypothetical protein
MTSHQRKVPDAVTVTRRIPLTATDQAMAIRVALHRLRMQRSTTTHQREIPTSAVSFVETEHGRLRRQQRGIDKKDLQRAKRDGIKKSGHRRPNGDPTAIYKYKDITYIVNEATDEEITSYASPLMLEYVPIDHKLQENHDKAAQKIRTDLNCWTSNTVMVVDTSGSMREADVWGTRTRLSAVWVAVALDFLAHRLETGAACPSDVLSVVTLCSEPKIVIKEEPCTWVLYNKLVRIYNKNLIPPRGHGPFLPCMQTAEHLLTRNPNASCALALSFLSDGKPSDAACTGGYSTTEWVAKIVDSVECLAKQFGRRLTFAAVAIGHEQDFSTLEKMVDAAKDYHSIGMFQRPSMTSAAIGEVFTSIATSLTSTQTEMTDVTTLKQRQVRQVDRVSKKKAQESIHEVSNEDFYIYKRSQVHRTVYQEWSEGNKGYAGYIPARLQDSHAQYVAFEKGPFGEGAERMAYRFYEVAADKRTIVGKPLVAKESRLILEEEHSDEHARKKFVRVFCKTQQLAKRLAEEFNEKLEATRRVHPKTPRVFFLDCSVYQLDDNVQGKTSVLVEERLDETKWYKWNANNGFVEGMKKAPDFTEASLREGFKKLEIEDLGMIEEDGEEEDDEGGRDEPVIFTPSEVAQAFSHYTYLASGRKRLVCDLQGVYDEKVRLLKFSDPVIHYHNSQRLDRQFVHGRTDRGKKGIAMFFATHREHCGHLCKLMNRGFRRRRRTNHQNR